VEKKMNEWALRFKDHKLTPQRRLILQVLLENKTEHLSAEEIYNLARQKDKNIGIATIYRTLELLEEIGIVHKCNFGDGRERYEPSLEGQEEHQHHHLICLGCRKILEVEEDLLNQLEQLIVEKIGFKIVDHRVQFYGYCRDCRREQDQ
jgi:Fur family transcriptional regulator, ferric uptake regulator